MIPQNSLKSDFKVSNVGKLEHGLSKNFKRNISVVYCRFLCELQSQALISPIQCCKQDGPPVIFFWKVILFV